MVHTGKSYLHRRLRHSNVWVVSVFFGNVTPLCHGLRAFHDYVFGGEFLQILKTQNRVAINDDAW